LPYLAVIGIGAVGIKNITRPEDYHHVSGPYILDGVSVTRRDIDNPKILARHFDLNHFSGSQVSETNNPRTFNYKELLTEDHLLREREIKVKESDALFRFAGGDARKLLNILELTVASEGGDKVVITDKLVTERLQEKPDRVR